MCHQRSREVRQRREGKARVYAHPSRGHLLKGEGAGVLIHQLQLIMDSGSQGVLNGQQNWLLWQKENLRQKCKCLQLGETENMGGT